MLFWVTDIIGIIQNRNLQTKSEFYHIRVFPYAYMPLTFDLVLVFIFLFFYCCCCFWDGRGGGGGVFACIVNHTRHN